RTVLDFAAGSGLVGVAAMRAGAASVLCADIDPFAGAAVAANAGAHGARLRFTGEGLLDRPAPDGDVVRAGDVGCDKPVPGRVVGADIDPFAGAAVAANAGANGVRLSFTGEDLLDRPPPDVDVICAGDVCYEKPMTERVLAWLSQAKAAGARVLIGDPGRSYFP